MSRRTVLDVVGRKRHRRLHNGNNNNPTLFKNNRIGLVSLRELEHYRHLFNNTGTYLIVTYRFPFETKGNLNDTVSQDKFQTFIVRTRD